jgi:hypothetical protein
MKIKNTHMIIDLINQYPERLNEYKKLVLSDKSQKYSRNVKLNIDPTNDKTLTSSLNEVVKLLSDRKYLLFYPNIDNSVIEVKKSNGIFEIFYHIGYRGEIYTFGWIFEVGKGFVVTPCFNRDIPLHLEGLIRDGFKQEYVNGQVPNIPLIYLLSMKVMNNLLPMVVYLDLSKDKVEYTYIHPNTKSGSVIKGSLIKNETDLGVYRVDSLWNVKHIGVGSFNVSGHFRLQRYGKGLIETKLIFIEEFIKTHYIRNTTRSMCFN